jgi:MATE family multidrug resistance protein
MGLEARRRARGAIAAILAWASSDAQGTGRAAVSVYHAPPIDRYQAAPVTQTRFIRAEARANLRLAGPLIATQLSFVGMGTVDTIFAGRLGAQQLAAVAVGANIWFLLFMLFMGLFIACSPIVAHRVGAGRPDRETGEFVRSAAVLALLMGLAWMLILRLSMGPILDLLDLEAQTRIYAEGFLEAISWGTVPFCLSFLLRNVAEGYGLTRVALAAALIGFAVNAAGDYALMYGRFGFPALGPAGCGYATAFGGLTTLVVYAIQYRYVTQLRRLDIFRRGWPRLRQEVWEVLHLGGPIAAILVAEGWLFMIAGLLMARFGSDTVAAHQIAINFASIAFMVPLSVGLATTVRVGHAAGAQLISEIRLRGHVGIGLGALFALASAAAMALLPRQIVAVYTEVPEVAAIAVNFLYYAAVFQLFDCVQATANGALRGLKDTRMPMIITVSAYWVVGMPLAVWLAFRTEVGPLGIWWGFIAGLGLAAVGLATRFWYESTRLKASVVMP